MDELEQIYAEHGEKLVTVIASTSSYVNFKTIYASAGANAPIDRPTYERIKAALEQRK